MGEFDEITAKETISELMARSDKLHAVREERVKDFWKCGVCGQQDKDVLHICEFHGKVFCKPCLSATEIVGENNRLFVAKCPGTPMNCIYKRAIPFNELER